MSYDYYNEDVEPPEWDWDDFDEDGNYLGGWLPKDEFMAMIRERNSIIASDDATMEHKRYIKSDKWDFKRKKILKKANYTCQSCGKKHTKLEVHHKTYQRLGNEKDEDLIVLCSTCHKKEHNKI